MTFKVLPSRVIELRFIPKSSSNIKWRVSYLNQTVTLTLVHCVSPWHDLSGWLDVTLANCLVAERQKQQTDLSDKPADRVFPSWTTDKVSGICFKVSSDTFSLVSTYLLFCHSCTGKSGLQASHLIDINNSWLLCGSSVSFESDPCNALTARLFLQEARPPQWLSV